MVAAENGRKIKTPSAVIDVRVCWCTDLKELGHSRQLRTSGSRTQPSCFGLPWGSL